MESSIYTRNSQSTSNESFSQLSQKIRDQGSDLQAKIAALQTDIVSSAERNVSRPCGISLNGRLSLKLENAVRTAQNVVPLASLNKHFYTPQSVSSIFTGRATDLDALRRCFQAPTSINQPHVQKRFVVFGLPGSGKTQFCCKFASDNKQRWSPDIRIEAIHS